MTNLPLLCDVCHEHIGSFNPDTISLPLSADQFGPATHNYQRSSLIGGADYLEMRCPVCHRRPFQYEHRIRIEPGGGDDRWYFVREVPGKPLVEVSEEVGVLDDDALIDDILEAETGEPADNAWPETIIEIPDTSLIDSGVCPYCKRKFKKPAHVRMHLRFCKQNKSLRLSRQAKESQNGINTNPAEGNDSGTDKGINSTGKG